MTHRIKPIPAGRKVTVREANLIEHPAHYQGPVECIDAIASALGPEGFLAHCRGSVMKYVFRAGKKGPAAPDLAKAAWYAARAVEVAEQEGL